MKTIYKFFKLVLDRALFIFIGICLSVSIFAVKAAWNTKVANNTPLTPKLWNDVVDKLIQLDNRVDVLQGTMCGMKQIDSNGKGSGLLSTCDGHDPEVSCPSGYTRKWFGESGSRSYYHWSCYKN